MVRYFFFKSQRNINAQGESRLELYPLPGQTTFESWSNRNAAVDTAIRAQCNNESRHRMLLYPEGTIFGIRIEGRTEYASRLKKYTQRGGHVWSLADNTLFVLNSALASGDTSVAPQDLRDAYSTFSGAAQPQTNTPAQEQPAQVSRAEALETIFGSATVPSSDIAVNPNYTTDIMYEGFHGYHCYGHNQSGYNRPRVADKPWRVGVELEVYARSQEAYDKITRTQTNWFQCERDSSLNQCPHPIEIKTIPLRVCDAKSVDFWDAPMAKLKELAKSKAYTSTGLHVHIGKEILGNTQEERNETLAKLLFFYVHLVEDNADAHRKNVRICGRESGYHVYADTYKSLMSDAGKVMCDCLPATGSVNPEMRKKVLNEYVDKNRNMRWDINTSNIDTYGTIEFRKGKGAISKTRLAGLITWWEQMCLYCKNTPFAELSFENFFNKVTSENSAVAYWFMEEEEA